MAGKLALAGGMGGIAARGLMVTAAPAALSVAADYDQVANPLTSWARRNDYAAPPIVRRLMRSDGVFFPRQVKERLERVRQWGEGVYDEQVSTSLAATLSQMTAGVCTRVLRCQRCSLSAAGFPHEHCVAALFALPLSRRAIRVLGA